MTIFAMRDNEFQNVSVLFSREPVHRDSVQFAGNFKKCFFLAEDWRHPTEAIPYIHVYYHLYMANGFTGEIRRLLSDMGFIVWRVSHDGRFIGFLDPDFRREYTHINLFDVENGVMIGQFELIISVKISIFRQSQQTVTVRRRRAARLQKTAVGASAFVRFFSATFCGCWSCCASPYSQPQNVSYLERYVP